MKNTLTDLNNYLFETLERLMDDDLTEEQSTRMREGMVQERAQAPKP